MQSDENIVQHCFVVKPLWCKITLMLVMLCSLTLLLLWSSLMTEIGNSASLSSVPYIIIFETNGRIDIANSSTDTDLSQQQHQTLRMDNLKSLFSIVNSYYNLIGVQGGSDVVSLLQDKTNRIFGQFFARNNTQVSFQSLAINNLKLSYCTNTEHQVSFDASFVTLIRESILLDGYYMARIAILTYRLCPQSLIKSLEAAWPEEESISAMCHVISDLDVLKHVDIVKDIIDNSQFTHLWLLLSPLDSEIFMSRVSGTDFIETQIITTLLTSTMMDQLWQNSPYIRISNIRKTERSVSPPRVVLSDRVLQSIGDMVDAKTTTTKEVVSDLIQNELPTDSLTATLKEHDHSEEENHNETIIVRVVTVIFPPYVVFLPNEFPDKANQCVRGYACNVPTVADETVNWKYRCCGGLAIDLFRLIAKKLGIVYHIHLSPDGAFGAFKNGSFNGMIGQLVANQADIAIQGIEPTNKRMKYVEFTPAYMFTHYVIVRRAKRALKEMIDWEVLSPLEPSLLVAILVSTIVTILFLYFTENFQHFFHHKSALGSEDRFPSRETMSYTFGLTFQRDMGGKNPVNWSGRIAALSFAVAMTVVMSTYTAMITAKSIVNDGNTDFNGIKDKKIVEPSPSFKFAVVKDTAQESYFINHPSSVYARVWNFMKDYSVKDTGEGVRKVYDNELDAFISDDNSILPAVSNRKYCSSLTIYNEHRRQSEVTFSYRKDFPYGRHLSNLILKDRDKRLSLIKDTKQKWIYIPSCNDFSVEDNRFTWMYFGGMLLVIGVSVATCVVIVVIENIYVSARKQFEVRVNKV